MTTYQELVDRDRQRMQNANFGLPYMGGGVGSPGGGPPGGGGAPAGPAPFDYRSLIDEYNRGMGQANKATEGRYGQALKTAWRSRFATRDMLNNYGQSALADVDREFSQKGAGIDNDLIGRGLYSSTVRDALQNRNSEAKGRTRGAVQQGIALTRANADSQAVDRILGVMNSREDRGPSEGLYAAAMNALAQEKLGKQKNKSDMFGSLLGLGGSILGGLL